MAAHPAQGGLPLAWYLLGSAAVLAVIGLGIGLPLTAGHDLRFAYPWLDYFSTLVRQGELYPRWLPMTWGGAGSTDFFFYAPLPYWLGSPFTLWMGTADALRAAATMAWLGSAALFFAAFQPLIRHHAAAAAGALIYALLPYHLVVDWIERTALAEFAAYLWGPPLVAGLIRLAQGAPRAMLWVSLATAGILLTHLPSALILATAAVVLCPALALTVSGWRARGTFAGRAVLAAGLGAALAAPYWLPAVTLTHWVPAQEFMYWDYYRWPGWLMFSNAPSPNAPWLARLETVFLQTIAIAGLGVLSGVIARLVYRRRVGPAARVWLAAGLMSVLASWLLTAPGQPLWQTLTILERLQFPWRFLLLLDLGAAMLAALGLAALAHGSTRGKWAAAAVLAAGLAISAWQETDLVRRQLSTLGPDQWRDLEQRVALGLAPWEWLTHEQRAYMDRLYRSRGLDRAPLDRRLARAYAALPPVQSLPSRSLKDPVVQRHSARHLTARFTLRHPARVTLRQGFWPLWRARDLATGATVELLPDPRTGLVAMSLPAGKTVLDLRLTHHWTERAGVAAAMVAAALLLAWLWRRRRAAS